jgi:endonuclease/exonuclease/phosphatase family metal-dependent hydrolase
MTTPEVTENYSSGWDRTFLSFSTQLAELPCYASGLGYRLITPLKPSAFQNYDSYWKEVSRRSLILAGAVIAAAFCYQNFALTVRPVVGLMLGWGGLRGLGFALQRGGYTYVAPSTGLGKAFDGRAFKLMSWNVCSFAGGLSFSFGGMPPWQTRLGAIVETIQKEDPDVLVLQEVFDLALAEKLVTKLPGYHVYMHCGPNPYSLTSGCLVMSKFKPHSFSFTSFKTNSAAMNRGFALLKLAGQEGVEPLCLVMTHLEAGEGQIDKEKRRDQFRQIQNISSEQQCDTFLVGDLNTEPGGWPSKIFEGGTSVITCTNQFTHEWFGKAIGKKGEKIDHILHCRNPHASKYKLGGLTVKVPEESDLTKVASDHYPVVATIKRAGYTDIT